MWCVVLGCVGLVWLVGARRGVVCCVGLCWAGVAGWGEAGVVFDESLFPWRPKGGQRVSPPIAIPAYCTMIPVLRSPGGGS